MAKYQYMSLAENVEEMFIGPFGSSLKNDSFVGSEEAYCMVYEQKHAIQGTMDVETRYVNRKKYDELKRFTVKGGDIIVSCRGTIGKTYVVPDDAPIGIMHPSIMKIRLKSDVYNKNYFNLLLRNILKQHELDANGSGVKMAISAKELGATLLPVPPIEEQNHIATMFDQVSTLISLRKQQIAKLDELVKSRFVEMFGGVTETVPLSYYIAALIAGKSLAGEEVCPNKVLKTGAVTYDYFDPTQIKDLPADYEPQEEHRVNTGDVIISRMNTAELVGAAAYVWEAPECTYLPDRLWKAKIKGNACPIFVWQILIQSSTKDSIRRIASGTSGSMKNISKPGLLGILVKKVPPDRQQQFVTFVAQTNQHKLTIQRSLARLEMLKKSLMQKYFG